jgi:hypothetical protein
MERRYGEYVSVCDECDAELDAEGTWQAAVEAKRAAGWRTERQPTGAYADICPACGQGQTERRNEREYT